MKLTKAKRQQTLMYLAIREQMMSYYKNSNPNYLTFINRGIKVRELNTPTRYQYQRRSRDMRQPSYLSVASIKIGEMYKGPSEFVVTVDPDRSPEVHKIVGYLRQFFREFLPTVKFAVEPQNKGERSDDSDMLSSIDVVLMSEYENMAVPHHFVYANEFAGFRVDMNEDGLYTLTDLPASQTETVVSPFGITEIDPYGIPDIDAQSTTIDPNRPF